MQRYDAPNLRYLRRPAKNAAAARRIRVDWPAELKCGDRRLPCTVIDISSAGAQLRAANVPEETRRVWLVLGRMGAIPALLAWRRDDRVGLRFLHEQNWLHDHEAKRFDASSWLTSGG